MGNTHSDTEKQRLQLFRSNCKSIIIKAEIEHIKEGCLTITNNLEAVTILASEENDFYVYKILCCMCGCDWERNQE